jgi:hypothetical protein
VHPVPDPLLFFYGSAGNGTRASGSVAKNSDHWTTEAVALLTLHVFTSSYPANNTYAFLFSAEYKMSASVCFSYCGGCKAGCGNDRGNVACHVAHPEFRQPFLRNQSVAPISKSTKRAVSGKPIMNCSRCPS